MILPQEHLYTTDDIYALPENQRAELIDGRMYMMAPPNTMHQRLVMNIASEIRNHIRIKQGSCEVFPAPFAVFLYADNQNYVEPDISVICDKSKLTASGYKGAPDWVIEIVSPSTERMDYGIKLFKYRTAGVREYWIINPITKTTNVFDFKYNEQTRQCTFDQEITSCIYEDFVIRIVDLTE